MEQAAASTLTGLFAQLGIAGIILAVLIAGAVWYLKASKDLREEKRGVIADLKADIAERDTKLAERDTKLAERDAKIEGLTRALLDCQYPGRLDHS